MDTFPSASVNSKVSRWRLGSNLLVLACLVTVLISCSSPSKSKTQTVIGLITDYGTQDSYVGQLKGSILSVNPDAKLVDISHQIEPYNLTEGAFLVSEASRNFPAGSIFVAVVDAGSGTGRPPVLVKTKAEKYYLSPNNGLLSLVLQREGFDQAWELNKSELSPPGSTTSATFHGRDLFGPIAGLLSLDHDPGALGSPVATIEKLDLPRPKFMGKLITGDIIHIDHYGNLVTNIPHGFTEQFVEGKVYRVTIGKTTIVAPLVKTDSDLPPSGRTLMLYNSADLLEISVNQGSAARVLHIDATGPITIQP